MKIRHTLLALPLLVTALPLLHCGDDDPAASNRNLADGGVLLADGAVVAPEEADKPLVPATKVDLLFVIDNSNSMAGKQETLAGSVNRVLQKLAITDIHVGVISSSLGNLGGDVCPADKARTNDNGHLLNKALGNGGMTVVPGAEAGFLALGQGGITDVAALTKATQEVVLGVDQTGCGLEAQLESMYRFLSQPDPPATITLDPATKHVVYGPVDNVLLAQRKAFLRPDSAVAVVMLTDEDDSMIDPRSQGGLGWEFSSRDFPGSLVRRGSIVQGTTAPHGTSTCTTAPASPDCTSCALCLTDPACKAKNDPACTKSGAPPKSGPGYDGYFGFADDDFNVRMTNMKQRFGVDPQYPVERYSKALSFRKVPNRDTEHDAASNYVHAATCTNPLFAASLPASSAEETCNLPEGSRSRQLVLFQLIGGVPSQLLTGGPDWTKILGKNRDAYDYSGIDPHMIQSIAPRAGLVNIPSAERGNNGTDPINGREWDTKNKDLQFACTFALKAEINCSYDNESCDCQDPLVSDPANKSTPPLCKEDGSATQTRGKAYPTIRELRVVQALGDRGLVASICAVDPAVGYGNDLEALATKLSTVLAK